MSNQNTNISTKVLVFDIETVPDLSAASLLVGEDLADPEEQAEAIHKYHEDMGFDFIKPPIHQVVAISFLMADVTKDEFGHEHLDFNVVRSGGSLESPEHELVAGFLQLVAKNTPRLVTYNGRGFDLPVLRFRAMKHGIRAPFLYALGDKWNNYLQRFSDWHVDLMAALTDYGAGVRPRLHEACAALGIPSKTSLSGDQVESVYRAGGLKQIREYCEHDVLATYLLYLKYRLFTGAMSKQSYESSTYSLISYLEKDDRAHLKDFLTAWLPEKANTAEAVSV